MTGSGFEKSRWREQLSAARRARPGPERQAARAANSAHLAAALRRAGVICAYLPLPSEPLDTQLLDELTAADVVVLVPVVVGADALDWVRYPTPLRAGPAGIAEPIGPRLGSGAVHTADVVLVPALAVDGFGFRLGRGGGHYDRTLAMLDPAQWDPARSQSDQAETDPAQSAPARSDPVRSAQARSDPGQVDPRHPDSDAVGPRRPDPRRFHSSLAGSDLLGLPRTIAVLFDGEWVPRLPAERYDVPVDAVVTPRDGIRRVARHR